MKYRKLRNAWSVAWGVVAVLICVLWVQSYWWWHIVVTGAPPAGSRSMTAMSYSGVLNFAFINHQPQREWAGERFAIDGPIAATVAGMKERTRFGFDLISAQDAVLVSIPYWFAVTMAVTSAALPWFPIWRFSLRTLLIAMTLVAVGLRVIVWLR